MDNTFGNHWAIISKFIDCTMSPYHQVEKRNFSFHEIYMEVYKINVGCGYDPKILLLLHTNLLTQINSNLDIVFNELYESATKYNKSVFLKKYQNIETNITSAIETISNCFLYLWNHSEFEEINAEEILKKHREKSLKYYMKIMYETSGRPLLRCLVSS